VTLLRRHGYRLAWQLRRAYWFVVRPRTAGVKCVIVHERRWLMIRNTYGHRQWTFPGGGVQRGESVEVAVRREVREEVGIELTVVRAIGSYFSTRNHCRDTVSCFVADVDTADAIADGIEIEDVAWVEPGMLPVPHSPDVDDVVALLSRSEG
jgi:8-oxo-dGTP pyrophosphatase MutT (NUDIX family)